MIKPKRQAKVVYKYKKQKPRTIPKFSFFRLFSLHLLTGLFFITIIISTMYPPTQSNPQTAEPITPDPSINLHSLTILPTETPITPPMLPLEMVANLTPTPIATVTTTPIASDSANVADDFCLNIPVVMYHHIESLPVATLLGHAQLTVDSSIFEDQMRYLKEHNYQALSADDLVNALITRQQLPEKSILVTIDDGYDDNYTYAFLMAKKYQMVMNFMIPTQLIGKPGYMNWDHLREMHSNEYARIYNHTATHAALGYILKDQIDNELTTSSDDFKKELGFDTSIFTYPYGSYNPIAIQALKDHGFIGGFTTDDGRHQCLSNIMTLKRSRIGNAPMSSYGF